MPILPLLMDPTLTNVDPTLALPTLGCSGNSDNASLGKGGLMR